MFSKRIMKNMKFYCPHKEPEYHQTANCSQASARFFMYYMSSQINHPGTVHSQINTATTLICQISHKNIFRSHLPAEISQQHTYQNHSIWQSPLFTVCHENSSFTGAGLKNALRKMCVQFPATNKLPYHTPNVNYIPDRYSQEISLTCLKNNNFFISGKNLDGFF